MSHNSVPMADKIQRFQSILKQARNIIVLTGAGCSAESGIPIFRGEGGFWRMHKSIDVATPQAFKKNPSLVWEFYHYRREVAFSCLPNKAHLALAQYEKNCKKEGRNFDIITQNVDGLHQKAGSQSVLELHGSLRKVVCTKCGIIETNENSPICESLKGRGDPKLKEDLPPIPDEDLPKCKKCSSLIRPYIVWFGENLDPHILENARFLIERCDLCLVVGTSSVVYPAAMFAPLVAEKGMPVAEFNTNDEPASEQFKFHFTGLCGETLPSALGIEV